VISPLLDQGKMPNLEKLVSEGVMGNLATLYPDLSPMLWTSIATGKRPFKHGIYGFTEPNPHGGGIRPITSLSRRTKALWNILSQADKKCNVIGWWPSHPVEPINGVMVSNHYQKITRPLEKPWPVPPGTVHPERLIRNLAELRWHPRQLHEGHILPFVPRAAEVDQDKDRRLQSLAKIICECCGIADAALAIMHHEPWDFTAVYFDAIDHFSHGFMRYHPPRQSWVPEKDFEIYRNVVEGGYHLQDIILGRLLAEAGEDATVILVSDHGFHSDHLRPPRIPREPAGPAAEHRPYGIIAMKGPGIKKDELIFGSSLLDICPTVLTLFGLPVGEDLDGKPLLNAFEVPPAITTIPSWDQIPGKAGVHPPDKQLDPIETREALNQLVALGYIEPPDEDQEKAVAQTVRELNYNLARSYMDAGRHLDAILLLENLVHDWPDEYRFGIQLVNCYQVVERVYEARTVLEALQETKEKNAVEARAKLEAFYEQQERIKPEDFSRSQRRDLRNLHAEASTNPYAMEYLMGSLCFAEGDAGAALEHLKKAEKSGAQQPGLYLKLGDVFLKMKLWTDAERCFNKALEIDPDNATGHLGLCRTLLARGQNAEALEAALTAVGLIYHYPMAHFLIGVALHRLGHVARAVEALRVAVSQNPNFPEAHRRLAFLYQRRLKDTGKAEEHRNLAVEATARIRNLKKLRRGEVPSLPGHVFPMEVFAAEPSFPGERRPDVTAPAPLDLGKIITVVSGLPRSGTSMVMQMLAAGGLPLLTDGDRAADEDNPLGYFEFKEAKALSRGGEWLGEARGKAVKIVSPLLRYLPAEFDYRVIFVERNLDEVVRSQQKMLKRQGKTGANLGPDRLVKLFGQQVSAARRLLASHNVPTLSLHHRECINHPEQAARAIRAFLGGSLDEIAMAKAVDPGLYRQRTG
jgi:tetratricopeptide (TPR) repeat protein